MILGMKIIPHMSVQILNILLVIPEGTMFEVHQAESELVIWMDWSS